MAPVAPARRAAELPPQGGFGTAGAFQLGDQRSAGLVTAVGNPAAQIDFTNDPFPSSTP